MPKKSVQLEKEIPMIEKSAQPEKTKETEFSGKRCQRAAIFDNKRKYFIALNDVHDFFSV